jgi:hypothetical protein
LIYHNDGPVAVLDVAPQRSRLGRNPDEHRINIVHARLREQIPILLVHQKTNVAGRHEHFRVARVVGTREEAAAVLRPTNNILPLVRVLLQVESREDVLDVLSPMFRAQDAGSS